MPMPAASGSPTQVVTSVASTTELSGQPAAAFRTGDLGAIDQGSSAPIYYVFLARSTQPADGVNVLYAQGTDPAQGGSGAGRWLLLALGSGQGAGALVVRPGAPPSQYVGNVFANFPAAYAKALPGSSIIFDATYAAPSIPAGIWKIPGPLLGGASTYNTPVTVEDGAQLVSSFLQIGGLLTLDSVSLSPVITTEPGGLQFIFLEDGAGLTSAPAAASFIETPVGTQQSIFLGDGTGLFPTNIWNILGQGFLSMENATVVNPGVITGSGPLQVSIDAASAVFYGQPGFTGALTPVLTENASRIGYNPVAGSWNAPPPKEVAEALDRCAALLKVLNGGTGP